MPDHSTSMRRHLRRIPSRRTAGVIIAALTVGVLSSLTPAAPASAAPGATPAGLTSRVCKNFNTGDDQRQLSVCSSIWIRDAPGQYRGVVDMHSYKLANLQRVGDSVSQSITLDGAVLKTTSPATPFVNYGADQGTGTCRLNRPFGPVSSCSTPNTASVTYYGKAADVISQAECNTVTSISWRDDRGQAHFLHVGSVSHPDSLPVIMMSGAITCP